MKLSYIIPVFNCGQYLGSCIKKIEKVGLCDYEIILIDDGSTDDSSSICDRLARENVKVRCIHQTNMGVSSARNCGLGEATGDYVFFIDADDDIDPERLHEVIEKLKVNPDIDMVIFGLSFDYYHKGVLYRRDELKTPMTGILDKNLWMNHMTELYHANSLSPIWNKIIRRGLLLENDIFLRKDIFIYEDLEYSLRCMRCCDKVLFAPEIVYHYRQSEDEGNAGRRLRRVNHLTDIADQIDCAFGEFVFQEQKEEILLSLYLVLAREKISVSNRKEISVICHDFVKWYQAKGYQTRDVFINQLLNCKVGSLIIKSKYTSIWHKIAVAVKNTAWYKNGRSE